MSKQSSKNILLFIVACLFLSVLVACVNAQAGAAVTYTLTVEVTPPDSLVRIMNIRPKYKPGIVLKPGTYDVYVTKQGYKSKRTSVAIGGPPLLPRQSQLLSGTSNTTITVDLEKLPGKLETSKDSDTFVYKTKGIKITKPHSWYFLNTNEVLKGRNNVEFGDSELEEIFRQGFPAPLVSIAKYRDIEQRSGPIPTVNLQLIKIDNIDNHYPTKLIRHSLNIVINGVSKFEYIAEPHITELSSHKAAKTIFKYVLYDQLGSSYAIKSELWAIPRGEYAIYIAMSAPMIGPDESAEEFARILKSFKVTN